MNRKKAVITVFIPVALTIFVIVAIWPALKGDSDGYQTKTVDVVDNTSVVEEVINEVVEPVVVEEDVIAAMDIPTEETPIVVEAVTEEVTEEVVVETAVITDEPPVAGTGQVHIVTAQGLKFSPLVTLIAPGDTVAWEKMSSHDTQAMVGLVPEGTEMWHSSMGESFQRTFMQEGIYIYKCTPHWGAAMGGVIIVGKPVNLEAIKTSAVNGAAKRLVKKAIKAAEAM